MKQSRYLEILYHIISAAFCVIVVLSNIISAKMVRLPFLHGFIIPAGLLTYPFTFLLSNLVTEIYGKKQASLMVYIAFGVNLLALAIIQIALAFPSATAEGNHAFEEVMGLGGLRIISSLCAYVIAQIVDIQLYAWVKKWTGTRFLWLRNNGSTWVSQMVDTVIIDIVFLYWGLGMEFKQVWPIMVFSYLYKASFSVANTPILYLFVFLIRSSWMKIKNLFSVSGKIHNE